MTNFLIQYCVFTKLNTIQCEEFSCYAFDGIEKAQHCVGKIMTSPEVDDVQK